MSLEFLTFCRSVENMALAVCITKAAMFFDRWSILWFLLVILVNHPEVRFVSKRYGETDGNE